MFHKGGKFEGEYKNDEKLKGRLEYHNGDVYDGEFNNDKKEGFGEMAYKNGNTYHGEYKNDLYHGHGVKKDLINKKLLTGLWEHGHFQGK